MYARVYKQIPFVTKDANGNVTSRSYSVWLAVRGIDTYTKCPKEDFVKDPQRMYRPIGYTVSESLYKQLENGFAYHFKTEHDMFNNRIHILGIMSDDEAELEDLEFEQRVQSFLPNFSEN